MERDLKKTFPQMSGFSPRNIKYMLKFARCLPYYKIVQQVAAPTPWRTNLKLHCYVVIELKACDFEPGFISQLNMY
ncbi:DUF1016 N-terminal domain-containing protein [Kineothrix sp. MB12-C1]|uniref:DUF1016 N-terminal domain-containing protein n=1 Tax=Kineothrix sp. MB12-C1 TaxID=3070215 RepID=UPI0027D2B83E|nr:DUF1016 N-terminal domain-containing protein [Kineothrix sp. MB12-C1]WMC93086.1 DUF1016 N-terminal domain-containing protein [Kineothrix sp. MB12-C1]